MTREELQRLYDRWVECSDVTRVPWSGAEYTESMRAVLAGVGDFLAEPDPTVEIAYLKAKVADLSDEYHTMDELYDYRMLYNALAVNAMPASACKSWRHSDGELCFGGGWFVVYLTLPTGQVSNHYKADYWDLFQVPEVETAPEYDGHTPQDAADRMRQHLTAPRAIVELRLKDGAEHA